MTAPAPLTLIVEGKPLVFDVPVPVGEVIPAGTWFARVDYRGNWDLFSPAPDSFDTSVDGYFLPRPPVAPESFADGDVAWVRETWMRGADGEWRNPRQPRTNYFDAGIADFIESGVGTLLPSPSPRPESLADVLDDANLPDELRARIEKAAEL